MENELTNDPSDFMTLLEDLIPPDLTIESLSGEKYKLPSKLSARRQIRAIRIVEKGFEILNTIDIEESSFSNIESMIQTAMGLLGNEDLIDLVDEAFAACYPDVADKLDGLPSDNFDIEDLVKAFGPLALAFAKTMTKAGRLMS